MSEAALFPAPRPPASQAEVPPANPIPTVQPLAPPVVPPGEPALAPTSHFDLAPGNLPVAHPTAPVAAVAPEVQLGSLEERIRKLEGLLMQLQHLQAHDRVAQQASTQFQQAPPPQTQQTPQQPSGDSSGPSVLGQARALFEVGRHLMPELPPGIAPPASRRWLIWEMIAELRAMVYMYVDPRYRMPWYGYILPPALFVAYLFSKYWVPFASLLDDIHLRWVLTVPVDVVLLYSIFKILGHEARRYRETAPDLPPSLRL
jgi:hypothetical protein